MTGRAYTKGARWAIILAGGEGTRLSSLTTRRFGEHRPKQYCAFLGERTMFDHTMDRAAAFAGGSRVVTVIGRGHARFLESGPRPPRGFVVEQPRNCDTAPGLYLPLAYVLAHDPEAVVGVFPSDHFIAPNAAFLETMHQAALEAESSGDIVLTAAVADRPEMEYGWIQPGAPLDGSRGARRVLQFHEKPDADRAAAFFRGGFLWNTLNLAVKGSMLWDLGLRHHPGMMERLARLRAAIGTARETSELRAAYDAMPDVNFSRGILERAVARTRVLPMTGVEWSDWGRPERIQEVLDRRAAAPRLAHFLAPAREAPPVFVPA